MKKLLFALTLLAASAALAFAQQQVPLGSAIQNAAEDISARASRGSRIAVVAMQTDSEGLSSFLVEQAYPRFLDSAGKARFYGYVPLGFRSGV